MNSTPSVTVSADNTNPTVGDEVKFTVLYGDADNRTDQFTFPVTDKEGLTGSATLVINIKDLGEVPATITSLEGRVATLVSHDQTARVAIYKVTV